MAIHLLITLLPSESASGEARGWRIGALIVEVQQILFWSGLRRRLRSVWCYSLNGRHFCYSHRCWRQKPDDQKADAEVTENAHGVFPYPPENLARK